MHFQIDSKLAFLLSCVFLACASPAHAAVASPILFDAPHGGEIYFSGQQQAVRLNAKTRAKSVLIELSLDGGVTFAPLGTINNAVKDKTQLNLLKFTVTGAGSNQCILRASAGASVGLSSTFTISTGAVVLPPASVGIPELADGSVTNPKLAALAVSNDKVTSGVASSGMVLTADGLGNANWNPTGAASDLSTLTGILQIGHGGTGSATQNFVDLTTDQNSITGSKTFTGTLSASTAFTVEPRPGNTGTENLFIGVDAGAANTSGSRNTFVGQNAGADNNGTSNSFFGDGAGFHNTTGAANCCFGLSAGLINTTGTANTFIGGSAGSRTTTGLNTFVGCNAGLNNTTGAANTFIGGNAGYSPVFLSPPITGSNNIAMGIFAGSNLTAGDFNIDIGNAGVAADAATIRIGTSGSQTNTFIAGISGVTVAGSAPVFINASGQLGTNTGIVPIANGGTGSATQNFVDLSTTQTSIAGNKTFTGTLKVSTAFTVEPRPGNTGVLNFFAGAGAGAANTNASNNTFVGQSAGQANIGGGLNTFIGNSAGGANTIGNNNTFVGQGAGQANIGGALNTFIGNGAGGANNFGGTNIAIGFNGGNNLTTGNNNIDIGNSGVAAESNTIRIGTQGTQTATFIAGINGVTINPTGSAVFVNSNGQLGTVNSSRRFKENIKDMGSASNPLLRMRPVSFTYKREFDASSTPQYGLIAEEVAAIDPDLAVRGEKGEINTVRYEQINAMLLNEFLKEHKKVDTLEAQVIAQGKQLAELQAMMLRTSKR